MMRFSELSLLLSISLLSSCADSDNPVSPSVNGNVYLGNVGTERTYKETEIRLNVDTNLPYYDIPDTLIPYLSLSENQFQEGVSFIRDYTEIVEPIEDDFYSSWELSYPATDYLQTEADGKSYSLPDEVEFLLDKKPYTLGNYGVGEKIFRIADNAIMSVHSADLKQSFPSLPVIKNALQLNDSWKREQFFDSATKDLISEIVVQVVTQEKVVVPAGTFNAYKLKLTTYHYRGNYQLDRGYEYYVPNVGLVLKKSDMDTYQLNTADHNTIHFRKVLRKELVSYNFVQSK